MALVGFPTRLRSPVDRVFTASFTHCAHSTPLKDRRMLLASGTEVQLLNDLANSAYFQEFASSSCSLKIGRRICNLIGSPISRTVSFQSGFHPHLSQPP